MRDLNDVKNIIRDMEDDQRAELANWACDNYGDLE